MQTCALECICSRANEIRYGELFGVVRELDGARVSQASASHRGNGDQYRHGSGLRLPTALQLTRASRAKAFRGDEMKKDKVSEADMTPLLTASEVATLLAISLRKFEQMVAAEEAPVHLRVGRLRRWRASDVQGWIAKRTKPRET
jgi:excisionase family DNA binding protein